MAPIDAYTILSNERRQHILTFLVREGGERISVASVADHLRDEYDVSRQAAYISMVQRHLPKMEGAGLIEFDSRAKTVTPTTAAGRLLGAHRILSYALRARRI